MNRPGSRTARVAIAVVAAALQVKQATGSITFSWPTNEPVTGLYRATYLSSTIQWLPVDQGPVVSNALFQTTVSASGLSIEFFHLQQP